VCSLQFGAYNPKGIVSAPVVKYWADTKDLFPRLTCLLLTDNDAVYSQHTLLNFLRPTLTKVHMIAHSAQYDALLSSCAHNSFKRLKSFEFDLIVLRPKAETLSDTPMRSSSVAQLLLRPYASMLISPIM
jgi:hypothetical protein